jgi:hypothetical protein
MNYVGPNYFERPVHGTNKYSKYFTVAVKNTSSWNMNVAIINDRSTISLITVLSTLS